ncbi:MAG: membrane dipeptidase [Tissierellia bacterium]|nr:membrane dipeptidase [Tissierellia bacterium]
MHTIYLLLILVLLSPLFLAFVGLDKILKAQDIHFNSMVMDSHNDTMLKITDEDTGLPKVNIGESTDNHIDIPKLLDGGIDALFFAAYNEECYEDIPANIDRTLSSINALYWTENKNPDTFAIARTVEDIEMLVRSGKIAAIPTIEGGYSLNEENGMGLMGQYYDLGIKVFGFTWNTSNALGEGVDRVYGDPDATPSKGGLTGLGRIILEEMNRLGVVVDVSHMAESTFWDIVENTKAPIMASHSGVYALRNHPRNLNDSQLKALAENGGVIGIVLYPEFLIDGYPEKSAYIRDYIDHIDYAVSLIGIDHVGIGSDFDGATLPADIEDSSQMYKITEELVDRGYSREDIRKVLGGNTLRVLREVEEIAEGDYYPKSRLEIHHLYDMGEMLSRKNLSIDARIEKDSTVNLDYNSMTIIIDGIPHIPEYCESTSILSLELDNSLDRGFHILTLQAGEKGCKPKRETIIIYIE